MRKLATAAGIVAIACLGAIWQLVYGELPEPTLEKINKFQTIIGALLATAVAVGTAVSVFFIARLPIEADKQRSEEERQRDKIVGAMTIMAATTEVLTNLTELANKRQTVDLPSELKSLEVIRTQDLAVVTTISSFMAAYQTYKLKMDEYRRTKDFRPVMAQIGVLMGSMLTLNKQLVPIIGTPNDEELERMREFEVLFRGTGQPLLDPDSEVEPSN